MGSCPSWCPCGNQKVVCPPVDRSIPHSSSPRSQRRLRNSSPAPAQSRAAPLALLPPLPSPPRLQSIPAAMREGNALRKTSDEYVSSPVLEGHGVLRQEGNVLPAPTSSNGISSQAQGLSPRFFLSMCMDTVTVDPALNVTPVLSPAISLPNKSPGQTPHLPIQVADGTPNQPTRRNPSPTPAPSPRHFPVFPVVALPSSEPGCSPPLPPTMPSPECAASGPPPNQALSEQDAPVPPAAAVIPKGLGVSPSVALSPVFLAPVQTPAPSPLFPALTAVVLAPPGSISPCQVSAQYSRPTLTPLAVPTLAVPSTPPSEMADWSRPRERFSSCLYPAEGDSVRGETPSRQAVGGERISGSRRPLGDITNIGQPRIKSPAIRPLATPCRSFQRYTPALPVKEADEQLPNPERALSTVYVVSSGTAPFPAAECADPRWHTGLLSSSSTGLPNISDMQVDDSPNVVVELPMDGKPLEMQLFPAYPVTPSSAAVLRRDSQLSGAFLLSLGNSAEPTCVRESSGMTARNERLSERASVVEPSSEDTCQSCFLRKSKVTLLPCGHNCVCSKCARRLVLCPVCGVEVEKHVKVMTS
eukprot:RCo052711